MTVVRRRKKKVEPKPAAEQNLSPHVGREPKPVAEQDPSPYVDREAMRDTSLSDKPRPQTKERPKGVVPPRREYKQVDGIAPFELFAGYHLGLTVANGYRSQNIHDLGRRFRTTPDRITFALKSYEIDSETVMNTDFDISMAEYDIRVAPEGVSRMELARQLYEDFRSSPRILRAWQDELVEDAVYNDFIFKKLK